MSVNYSAYPATGVFSEKLGIYYRTAQDIYNAVGGFGKSVDKRIALSWSNYHLAGSTFYFPNKDDVTQNSAYSLNFNPSLSKNNRVYNILTACQTATTFTDNATQGYNTPNFVYPEITNSTRYTLNGVAVRYLSDYQPSRIFEWLYDQNKCTGLDGEWIDFCEAWLHMEDVADPHYWSADYWNLLESTTTAINNVASVNAYDNVVPVISRFTKITRMIDDNFTTSIFCRGWSSDLFNIVFNSENGLIDEITYPTGLYDFFTWDSNKFYVFGNIPVIKNLNIQEIVIDLFNPSGDAEYVFMYFDGVAYKNDNGVFVDALGRELTGDVENGGLRIEVWWRSGAPLRVILNTCQHIKSILKTLCSYGIPVRSTQSYTNSTPLNAVNPRNPEVSQFYQTKINVRTGEVKGEPQPLYNPENIQLITNPNEIDLTYSDNIPIIETPLEVPKVFYISKGVRTYAMGQGDFNTLMQKLYELPTDIFEIVKGFNENISESIRNVTVFPFNIVNYFHSTTANLVYYGEELLPQVNELRRTNCIINMGNFIVEGDGTFMDYEPYTQYYIYLPYVGIRKLDSRDVVGVSINVQYIVDAQTGECRANIFRGGVLVSSYNGVCGINIPIVSRDYSTLMSNVNNTIASFQKVFEPAVATANRAYSESGWMGMGDPFSAGFTAASALPSPSSVVGALSSTNIYRSSVAMSGEAGTTSAFTLPQYPYIIKIRSRYELPDNYGHSVGYVCEESGKLSDYTGYTVCDNVDVSGIPCLESEKNMIKALLQTGVYL